MDTADKTQQEQRVRMHGFNILTEVPPISASDTFVMFARRKKRFDFPLHIHSEFELNFITGAKGATRVVGDHVSEIGDRELVLIAGSYLEHAWYNGNTESDSEINEVTIQFRPDLFYGGFIERKQFANIKKMMEIAKHGISFSPETIAEAEEIISRMTQSDDNFNSILLFLSLLNTLAHDHDYKVLSHSMFSNLEVNYDSRRINKIMEYLGNNYTRNIKLSDIAGLVNMSEASFSRFIKMRTGQSFVDCLNGIRISVASRMLVQEPTRTISEVAFKCGFNNLSNFNRIFKKKKGYTPHDFREYYVRNRMII